MNNDTYRELLALLRRLDDAKIAFTLRHSREDAVMVQINVPGERWEVEFVDYDDEVHIEIERFISNGEMHDEALLEKLFAVHSADAELPDKEVVDNNDVIARK